MELSLRNLGNKLRKFKLENRSVLAVRSGTILSTPESLMKLQQEIEKTSVKDVIVVVLDDLNDISVISEATMNKLGWFKVNHLSKIIKKEREQ